MNRPREDTHDPGADRYFDGPPIVDSSGSVKVVGSTVRRNRDPGGRWKPRESRIVGPLNKPTGPGGIDTVTGGWIPGVRDNSQLHDLERVTRSRRALTTRAGPQRECAAGTQVTRSCPPQAADLTRFWIVLPVRPAAESPRFSAQRRSAKCQCHSGRRRRP